MLTGKTVEAADKYLGKTIIKNGDIGVEIAKKKKKIETEMECFGKVEPHSVERKKQIL